MSKSVLIGSLAACFLAVGVIAVLTATVITNDGGGGRILRAEGSFTAPGPGMPMPGHGRGIDGQRVLPRMGFDRLPELKSCIEKQAIGPDQRLTPPGPSAMRDALKACAGLLPGTPPALR